MSTLSGTRTTLSVLAAAAIIACTSTSVPPVASVPAASRAPPMSDVIPSTGPASLNAAVEAARADAAHRTGVPVHNLVLLSAESVTWSDGSLGCPQPGTMYTQALVPGYRIRIDAGGQILDYHAGARGGAPRLCPPGRAIAPVGADPRV